MSDDADPADAAGRQVMSERDDADRWATWAALHREAIERYRETAQAGDGRALLAALESACVGRCEMPDWLQQAIVTAIRRYTHHQAHTLDEAFNVKRPNGYRRKASRDRATTGFLVWFDVSELVSAGAVVDEALFEAVGSLHGVGKTTAAKWYYTYLERTPRHGLPMALEALPARLAALKDRIGWKAE